MKGHNPRNYNSKNIIRIIKSLSDLYDITPTHFLVAYDAALVMRGLGSPLTELCIYLTNEAWERFDLMHRVMYDIDRQFIALPGNIKLRPIELCPHKFKFGWVSGVMTADFESLLPAFKDIQGKSDYAVVNERNLNNLVLVETALNSQRQRSDRDLQGNIDFTLGHLTSLIKQGSVQAIHEIVGNRDEVVTNYWKDSTHKKWIYSIVPGDKSIYLKSVDPDERYKVTVEKL